jgi:hypothetical protein
MHSWIAHSYNIFGVTTSHGQIQIHKTHHGPDMGETTTFPFIAYFVSLHEAHIQKWHFILGVSKFSKLGLP